MVKTSLNRGAAICQFISVCCKDVSGAARSRENQSQGEGEGTHTITICSGPVVIQVFIVFHDIGSVLVKEGAETSSVVKNTNIQLAGNPHVESILEKCVKKG